MPVNSLDGYLYNGMRLRVTLLVCMAVPLVLTVLISAMLWDVICFDCGAAQQWQASMLGAAKGRSRAGIWQSRALSGPMDEPSRAFDSESDKAREISGGPFGILDEEDYEEFAAEWDSFAAVGAAATTRPDEEGDSADDTGSSEQLTAGGGPAAAATRDGDVAPAQRTESNSTRGAGTASEYAAEEKGVSGHRETRGGEKVVAAGGGDWGGKGSAGGAGAGEFAFKLLEPGSIAYGDVRHCPASSEPNEEMFTPLHPGLNMLVVAGVQKGGTTWMARALMKHPDLIHATHGYRLEKPVKTKEVHYLDRWPHFPGSEKEYVEGYPASSIRDATADATAQLRAAGVDLGTLSRADGVRAAYANLSHSVAFVDATPNYMPVAHVPPRASRIIPHARLVFVLRDPVARALSAYNMDRGRFCSVARSASFLLRDTLCHDTAFADTVEATTGEEARDGSCVFDGLDSGGLRTWHDCYKCWHMFHNMTYCTAQPPPRPLNDCNPPVLTYVHASMYAAQLAWWLAFYPPEQILILTSAELRDPERQIQALNKILDHARLPGARRFTREWLDSMHVDGFVGTYKEASTERDIDKGVALLRRRFRRPTADLVRLVNRFWPHMNFTGLPDEV